LSYCSIKRKVIKVLKKVRKKVKEGYGCDCIGYDRWNKCEWISSVYSSIPILDEGLRVSNSEDDDEE